MIDVDSVAQAVLYAVLLPPNVNPSAEFGWIRPPGRCRQTQFTHMSY